MPTPNSGLFGAVIDLTYRNSAVDTKCHGRHLQLGSELEALPFVYAHLADNLCHKLAVIAFLYDFIVGHLLFDMKWMAKLEADIRDEIEQVLNSLSSKVLLIAKRYEHTLGEIEDRTAKSRAAVVAALERMGYKW